MFLTLVEIVSTVEKVTTNHCLERKWVSHNTHGGFSEYTTAHVSGLFKLPESMSFEEGALVEPLAVSYRAVGQARADLSR